MTSNVIVQQINGGPIGVKNAIINGNFGVNQRAVTGTVTLAAGVYGHDRWKAGASGCTYTFATSENVTTLTISAGSLIQVVEDVNLLTDTYTLSWTGTAQGKIGAGSYGASGITGSVTGGSNLNIEFNTGTVSKVQLERGTVATPFEFRSIGQELALCQRYLPAFNATTTTGPLPGSATALTTNAVLIFNHPVPARVQGTGVVVSANTHFNFSNNDGNSSSTAVSFAAGSTDATQITITVAVSRGATTTPGWIYANNVDAKLFITGCEL